LFVVGSTGGADAIKAPQQVWGGHWNGGPDGERKSREGRERRLRQLGRL